MHEKILHSKVKLTYPSILYSVECRCCILFFSPFFPFYSFCFAFLFFFSSTLFCYYTFLAPLLYIYTTTYDRQSLYVCTWACMYDNEATACNQIRKSIKTLFPIFDYFFHGRPNFSLLYCFRISFSNYFLTCILVYSFCFFFSFHFLSDF